MGFTYLRKYVNPINHEPWVQFQFSKLFWNPYNITFFYDSTHIAGFFGIFSVKRIWYFGQGRFFKPLRAETWQDGLCINICPEQRQIARIFIL